MGTDGRRCQHPALRMTWIGVLTTGTTVTDGLSRWAIAAAENTNGWCDWWPVSRQGQWRLARLTLSNSASLSGPSKAATGAARQTPAASPRPASSRAGLTEGQRAEDARMNRLGTRGNNELELTCRRRENEGTRDESPSLTRMSRKERKERRLRQEQPPLKPERVWPSGPPATPPARPLTGNVADVKASSTRAEFKLGPGRGEGTRRYAIKAWFWAGRRRPEAARVPPALARFVLVDMY